MNNSETNNSKTEPVKMQVRTIPTASTNITTNPPVSINTPAKIQPIPPSVSTPNISTKISEQVLPKQTLKTATREILTKNSNSSNNTNATINKPEGKLAALRKANLKKK